VVFCKFGYKAYSQWQYFHAKYVESEILIVIETLITYSGSLPSRALALVLEWASLHKEELMENWSLAKNDLKLKNIEPLK